MAPSAVTAAPLLPVSPALFVFPGPQQPSGWPSKETPYIRCVPPPTTHVADTLTCCGQDPQTPLEPSTPCTTPLKLFGVHAQLSVACPLPQHLSRVTAFIMLAVGCRVTWHSIPPSHHPNPRHFLSEASLAQPYPPESYFKPPLIAQPPQRKAVAAAGPGLPAAPGEVPAPPMVAVDAEATGKLAKPLDPERRKVRQENPKSSYEVTHLHIKLLAFCFPLPAHRAPMSHDPRPCPRCGTGGLHPPSRP